jgi:hypothetical protein
MTRRTETLLTRLQSEGVPPSPAHRDRLEADLMSGYDKRYARPTAAHRRRWIPALAAAALLVGVLGAAKAPAEYAEELGQRIEVRAPPGQPLPRGAELAHVLETGLGPLPARPGARREVNVHVLRSDSGSMLRVDVWGQRDGDLLASLRERIPALAFADVRVVPLQGRVRTNLAGLVRHRFLRTPANPELLLAARHALEAEIGREGGASTVEVDVEDAGGKRRVLVRIRQTDRR